MWSKCICRQGDTQDLRKGPLRKLRLLFFIILLLVFILSGCSQARSIAQKAEQANHYKKEAVQQLQKLTAQAASNNWSHLNDGQSIDVRLGTTRGDIDILLAFQLAPLASASFLYLAGHAAAGDNSYMGARFQRPEGAAYVYVGSDTALPSFPAEFSEWLNFRQPGTLAFTSNLISTNVVNQASFFISLTSQADLFGQFSVLGQVEKGLSVARRLEAGDQILSIKIHSDSLEGKEFLDKLGRDGLKMLQRLRAEVPYKRQGMAAIHQKLARDFVAVQWPRYQRQDLQQPKGEDTARMRDWGLEYKVLETGSGEARLADSRFRKVQIQYAVWATQNDGHSLLLEDRIQKQQSVWVELEQLFPAWQAALLDMRSGEKRLYLIPPEGAYGIKGKQPSIPPWSYLVMELYLDLLPDFY